VRSRRTELLAGLGCLLSALACEQVFGLDEYALAPGPTSATGGGGAPGGGAGGAGEGAGGSGGQFVPADCCIDALPPEGWAYVQMNVTSFGGEAPACGGMPDTTFSGPPSHASCPACECAPGSASCTSTLLCGAASDCSNAAPIADCENIPATSNYCRVQYSLTEGSCTPSNPGLELSTWGNAHHLCGELSSSTSQECAPGQLCADTVNARLCVMMDGEIDVCPSGFETERFLTHRSADDTRTCSACSCGAPSGGSCGGGSYDILRNADILCTTFVCSMFLCPQGSVTGTTCQSIGNISDPNYGRKDSNPVATPGTCAPSGGNPSGAFVPEEPVTVCCR
jgi:hypothetical protein